MVIKSKTWPHSQLVFCLFVSAHTDLHLVLDPGPDDISLVGKLSAQTLVVLLPGVLLNQSLVALRHQLPDLQQGGEQIAKCLNE